MCQKLWKRIVSISFNKVKIISSFLYSLQKRHFSKIKTTAQDFINGRREFGNRYSKIILNENDMAYIGKYFYNSWIYN